MFFWLQNQKINFINLKLVFGRQNIKLQKNYNFRIYKIVENDRY